MATVPTAKGLALMVDIRDGHVCRVRLRSGPLARNTRTRRHVTGDVRQLENAGWVQLGRDSQWYEVTPAGRVFLQPEVVVDQ